CRGIDAFKPLGRGDGQKAQGASLDLGLELAQRGNARSHLIAKDRGQSLAATGISDVVDLGRIDACGFGDQANGDMVGAPGRATGPADRDGISLQRLDKTVDVLY